MSVKPISEPVDWDIVLGLMECYGMLNARGFPILKKKAKRVARQQRALQRRES